MMIPTGFGAADAFNAVALPALPQRAVQYLQQQVTNLPLTLTQMGAQFMQRSREIFERTQGAEAMRFARSVIQNTMGETGIVIEAVVSLWQLTQMQNASLTMQKYIMANEVVREAYHNQRCYGYASTYVDEQPGVIGMWHYDWRRVTDQMEQTTESGDWMYMHHFDELKEDDRDLTFDEKCAIMHTWTAAEMFMALGSDDPTGEEGMKL